MHLNISLLTQSSLILAAAASSHQPVTSFCSLNNNSFKSVLLLCEQRFMFHNSVHTGVEFKFGCQLEKSSCHEAASIARFENKRAKERDSWMCQNLKRKEKEFKAERRSLRSSMHERCVDRIERSEIPTG